MAIHINEDGNIKDLGVGSNLDWNGIEYLGQQPCTTDDSTVPTPTFNLPRPLSDYKYMILFGHMNNVKNSTAVFSGILVFSPTDVYNNDYHAIYVSFMYLATAQNITITDLAALTLTTFKQGKNGSFQRLYGIY